MKTSPRRTPTRYNLRDAVVTARERTELEKERTIAQTLHIRRAATKKTQAKRSSSEISQYDTLEQDTLGLLDTLPEPKQELEQEQELFFQSSEQVEQLQNEEKTSERNTKRRRMQELYKQIIYRLNVVRSVVAPLVVGSAVLIGKYIFENYFVFSLITISLLFRWY